MKEIEAIHAVIFLANSTIPGVIEEMNEDGEFKEEVILIMPKYKLQ